MKTMRTPIRCCAVVFALLALSTAPVLAGVNRWTSSLSVTTVDVVIDPVDPNVVYAGTLEGVFKSSNGGLSWSDPSNGELDGTKVHCLAIDPLKPSSVYAGTDRGVLKSTDGGATWSDSRTAGAICNVIFGSQKPTIYAADCDEVGYHPAPSAVYKSTDEGETWSRVAAGFSIGSRSLVVDPTESSTLYAGTSGRVYKSVDGGSTWRMTSLDLASYGFGALALDPLDPATLYAAASLPGECPLICDDALWASDGSNVESAIFKSTDAGSTWRILSRPELAGFRTLAINPRDPSTLYAATYLGVFRSTDGGIRWHEFNTGLTNRDMISLAIDWTGTRLHAGGWGGVFDFQISSGAVDQQPSTRTVPFRQPPPPPPPLAACPIEGGLDHCDPNGMLFDGTWVNNTSTVIGKVVGPGGVPVADAVVSTDSAMVSSTGEWCHAETRTDAAGNFTLNVIGVRGFDWGFFNLPVKVSAPVGTKTIEGFEAWACPTNIGTIVLP